MHLNCKCPERGSAMTQSPKALAVKSDHPLSTWGTHMVGEKADSHEVPSDLHTSTVSHIPNSIHKIRTDSD